MSCRSGHCSSAECTQEYATSELPQVDEQMAQLSQRMGRNCCGASKECDDARQKQQHHQSKGSTH
jgi:hypothetical protein